MMTMAEVMMTHWKEIEKVLDKYHVSEKDREKALDAYKAICLQWNECNASARAFEEKIETDYPEVWKDTSRPMGLIAKIMRYEREQWPDEWSVTTL